MSDHGAPGSYLTLQAGTPVFGSDDEEVGTVEHVLAATDKDIFDGLVLQTPDGRRFADAPQVASIHERGVVLTLPASEAGALPEPSENAATMGVDPADAASHGISDKLRRAWDLVSGNY